MIDDAYTRPCNSKINEHSASEWLSQFSNNSKNKCSPTLMLPMKPWR